MTRPVKLGLGGKPQMPIAEVEAALRVAIDEDELAAQRAASGTPIEGWDKVHSARHDPARVVAEVKAKRDLLNELDSYGGPETNDARDVVVRHLARVYGIGGEA